MNDRLRETDAQPLEQWRMDRLYRDLDGVKQAEILGWKADLTWGEVASLIATIEHQGKALRAVEALADEIEEYEETQKPAEAMDLAALAIVRGIRRALNQMEFRPWFIAAAELIERQGKALRAVEQLCVARCNANEYDIEPYDPTIAFIATVYAALAQTEPQTADEAKENPS